MLLNLGVFWFSGNILPIREGKKKNREAKSRLPEELGGYTDHERQEERC